MSMSCTFANFIYSLKLWSGNMCYFIWKCDVLNCGSAHYARIMIEHICFTLQDVDSFEPIWKLCFIIPYCILSSEYDADENKPLCLFMNIYFFQTFNSLVIYPPNLEKAHPPTMNNIFMPKMHSVYSQWVWLSISIIRKPVMRDFWNRVICTVNQNRSF